MSTSFVLRWNFWRTRTGLSAILLRTCSQRNFTNGKLCSAPGIPLTARRRFLCTVSKASVNEVEDTASNRDYFKHLLNNSQLVQSIDPVGKVAEAEVISVSGENLYVDFGGKFHAVVPLPKENRNRYGEGTKVLVLIKDLELTDHFLGAKKHISLLEADVELVGLAKCTTTT